MLDRGKLIDVFMHLDRHIEDRDEYGICYTSDFVEAVEIVLRMLKNEAEPVKRGCWVGTADGYADGELIYDMWECSECGYDADGADEKPNWNYCPNCGVDMRERRQQCESTV